MDAITQRISIAQGKGWRLFSLNDFRSRASKEENRKSIGVRSRWRPAINRKTAQVIIANCHLRAFR
jgi:hypothetical protein